MMQTRIPTSGALALTSLLFALAVVLAPSSAPAQGFFDIYVGAAFPQKSEVDTSADDPIVAEMIAYSSDVDWETSPSLGIRGGYWFTEPGLNFIGIALDASYYQVHEDSSFAPLDVYLTPLTPLLMLRIPIGADEYFPGGRVQPYGAVGPGFTVSSAFADLDDLVDDFSGLDTRLDDFDDASFDVGLDARAGIAFMITPGFGLFGEYRYTYVEPEFEDEVDAFDNDFGFFETDIDIDPEIETHHIVFGASFRF
jgi:opacity protein-like surface antigen